MPVAAMTLGPRSLRAWVFEHVLDPAALLRVHDDVRQRPFTFTNNDSADTEFARHLVHTVPLGDVARDPVFATLANTAGALARSVGVRADRLERVYANFALFGDYHHVHTDGDVWTVLFFANAQWRDDWGGELLLYEDDDATMARAIAPRPGRAVLFDGDLLHRAGAPSKYCPEPRLTVAVKLLRG